MLNQVKEVSYSLTSTQLPEYIAVILKTGLRAAAAEDVYYLTDYVEVMFQDLMQLQE